ncbi:hypothetical protein [Actinoplanes sp. URMC 104]|uniref:hypothetical protein n=1 Tax=Actinoplanes sp. URMC 104 TaxID=3423409 RepID=UPI003F1B59D3
MQGSPRYFIVAARTWVHAYATTEDLVADDAITLHHCGGLEFFDSDGHRYAPVLGAGRTLTTIARTPDPADPAVVAARIRTALGHVRRQLRARPREIFEKVNENRILSHHEASIELIEETREPYRLRFKAGVGGAGRKEFTLDDASFGFDGAGETLEQAIASHLPLLGIAAEPREPEPGADPEHDHTANQSWEHRLCHAVGLC